MLMGTGHFQESHKYLLREALVIAEEMTSDFFKLSSSHWLRARYDILTRQDLRQEEISPHALALVARYQAQPQDSLLKSSAFDFYRVCLQDHNILKTLHTRLELQPLPLMVYVLTHELVHIVRFSRFEANFEASWSDRCREEETVHRLTQRILTPLSYLGLAPVWQYYEQNWSGG